LAVNDLKLNSDIKVEIKNPCSEPLVNTTNMAFDNN